MKDNFFNRRKASLIFIMLFFFSISLVSSASNSYLPSKQSVNYTLIVTSLNSSFCNLSSIQYPNGNVFITDLEMSKSGQSFTIIIDKGNYSTLGFISYNVICSDSKYTIIYEITPSGFTNTSTFFFIFIIIIALIYLLGMSLKKNWIMLLGSILVLIFGFFIIINGVDIIKDTTTTWAIGIICWAIGIYGLFLSAEEALKEWG